MNAHLSIHLPSGYSLYIDPLEHGANGYTYDFMTAHGYSHEDAAEVADWAELASIGEGFDFGDGSVIEIVD